MTANPDPQALEFCFSVVVFTPVLRDLHWLPVSKRIDYKLLLLSYQSINKSEAEYLSELIPEYKPNRELRSSSQKLLQLPGKKETLTKYSQRAFSYAAPILWKSIPLSMKQSSSKAAFKSNLNTYLF